MSATPSVFVVDDDPAMRDSLRFLIRSIDLPVEVFASAEEFLEAYSPQQACLAYARRR